MVREDTIVSSLAVPVSASPADSVAMSPSPADPLAFLKAFISERNIENGRYTFIYYGIINICLCVYLFFILKFNIIYKS